MGEILTPLKLGGDYGDVYVLLNGVTVNALGMQISAPVPLYRRSYFGLWYKVTSPTGTPKVRLRFQESPNLDADNFTVPRGADGAYISDIETALSDKTALSVQYVGGEATARVTVADFEGFDIQYVGGEATATVEVGEDTLILCAPAGRVLHSFDLTDAAYDTVAELVAAIDGLEFWTCVQGADLDGAELSKHLAIVSATACKAAAVTLMMDRCIFGEAPNGTPDTNFGVAGKIFLRDTAKDTIVQLVAFIDALDDWTCTQHEDMSGGEPCVAIKLKSAAACKDAPVALPIEVPRIKSLSPSPMRYLRLIAQGVDDNPADTVVTAKLFVQ